MSTIRQSMLCAVFAISFAGTTGAAEWTPPANPDSQKGVVPDPWL